MAEFRDSSDAVIDYITIRKPDGESIDISNIVGGFEIFEDIYSAGTTARFHMNDGVNFYDKFKISGGEIISIKMYNDYDGSRNIDADDIYKKEFHVNNVVELAEGPTDRSHLYTIEALSEIYSISSRFKISRHFNDYNHNVVSHICNRLMGIPESKLNIEKTKYVNDFIIPRWSPIKTLDFLSENSISDSTNGTGYLFFEDKNRFNFVSTESLFKQDTTKFISQNYLATRNLATSRDVYQTYSMSETGDINELSLNGAYGGTLHTVDIATKSTSIQHLDVESKFDKWPHLNKHALYYPKDINNMKYECSFGNTINSDNFKLQRLAEINKLNNFVFMVKLAGDTRLTIGTKIHVNIPSHLENDFTDESTNKNKFLSGYYLVRAIRHMVSEIGYHMSIELSKDTL